MIALGIAICVGALLYAVMVFVLRLVKREDVLMMPKGEKLVDVLGKFHLLS